jgi:hypothetical protein
MVQAERIAERFWNFNGTFDWTTKTNKEINPMYAAKMWNPVPDELGGHACTDTALAGAYFDFAKGVEHMHPDASKLLTEFNNIEINDGATTITFNDGIAGDILDTILLNNQETAYKAFKARFGVKTISYLLNN